MLSLSEIAENFLQVEEQLDPVDLIAYRTKLDRVVRKLALSAAELIGDYDLGEIPALLARCATVLAWIKAQGEDAGDRQLRYGRQQAVTNLLILCEGIRRFHVGKQRTEDRDALEALVGSALAPLVVEEE